MNIYRFNKTNSCIISWSWKRFALGFEFLKQSNGNYFFNISILNLSISFNL